ncbi:MAG: DMT family transporter [Flavitalea sp.]
MARSTVKIALLGVVFAILWSSASTATKIGLGYAQPFTIAVTRFLFAGTMMLFITHVLMRNRVPGGREWKQITIYGILNVSIYLGLFVISIQHVSAGIGSLFIATNPVFISIISSIWFKKRLKAITFLSLGICCAGILVAAFPLLQTSHVTPLGLILLLISMLSYSLSALYYSRQSWNGLHILTINGWQTLIGGLFLIPLLIGYYDNDKNVFDIHFAGVVLWLAIPVSIGAMQLWMFLLRDNPVKASFWLFLCPIFGFIIAAIFMKEPITVFTFAGVALVLSGLYLVQRQKTENA